MIEIHLSLYNNMQPCMCIGRVISSGDLFSLILEPELLPFSCACLNSSMRCRYLQHQILHWTGRSQYLESLRKKLTSRVCTLEAPCWGAGATTLLTATLALVHSTVQYCAPVWCRSAHTCLIDFATNDSLGNATGCLPPTTEDNLLFSRASNLLSFVVKESEHLLHSALICPPSGNARHLKSRHPFVPAA